MHKISNQMLYGNNLDESAATRKKILVAESDFIAAIVPRDAESVKALVNKQNDRVRKKFEK